MLFILEGPDMAGKTTLARDLARELERYDTTSTTIIMHSGPIKEHPLREYVLPLVEYQPGSGVHVICDRLHLGELVYGPLLRGESKLTPPLRRYIDAWLASRGAVVVYVWDKLDVLERRYRERGDDLVKIEQLGAIVRAYDELFSRDSSVIHYCVVTTFDDPLSNIVEPALMRESAAAYMLGLAGTFVGDPRYTNLLLVGDTRNGDPIWPSAFVPFESTSGHYLMQALDSVGIRHWAVLNACDDDGSICASERLYNACVRYDRIVTLGENAHKRLTQLRIHHGAVPHPQFWRRFHHREVQSYGMRITRAALNEEDLRGVKSSV